MKLTPHWACPAGTSRRGMPYPMGRVVRLYYRHAKTRKWIAVGSLCLNCGKAEVLWTHRLPQQ